MASHDQLDAAPTATADVVPGAAPQVVPIAAPSATQVDAVPGAAQVDAVPDVVHGAAPDAVPAPAPTAAQVDAVPDLGHHAARGGGRATSSGRARGVPRRRARRPARAPAPDAAPVPGQAAPAAPAGGPAAPPPRIDIDAVFAFSDQEVSRLQHSILTSEDGLYRDICVTICRSLLDLSARFRAHHSFTPDILASISRELRAEVSGTASFDDVKRVAPKDVIQRELFPEYEGTQGRVRGYRVTRCRDPIIAGMIYPRFLAAHGRYPNNDQIPLYFAQQLYAEFRIGLNVNYLDIPGYLGQGRGRIADRDQYRSVDRLPPADLR